MSNSRRTGSGPTSRPSKSSKRGNADPRIASRSGLKIYPLRAHNLLCLQGFQGMGYDEGFTANMAALHERLRAVPDPVVRVVPGPDHLCAACPHLGTGEEAGKAPGCNLGGNPHEAHMARQDTDVSRRLGIAPGHLIHWQEILERIAARIDPGMLSEICTTCPWLPLGVCAEGVARLRKGRGIRPGGAGNAEETS